MNIKGKLLSEKFIWGVGLIIICTLLIAVGAIKNGHHAVGFWLILVSAGIDLVFFVLVMKRIKYDKFI